MTERIVFLSGRPEFLYDRPCRVVETYHFGDWGSAALVEYDADDEPVLLADDRVVDVEENLTASLAVEPDAVSEDPEAVATIEDVRRLHDVPSGGGTGAGVTVVAMDSGVDTSHPVFSDDSVKQVDVTGSGKGDAVGHGTAVLGQVTRLAPEADLVSLRIFGEEGQTKTNVIMRAYEWLHTNADAYDVVNMSWGSQRRSAQIDRVHDRLVERGVRDVVAAGNTGGPAGSPSTAERAFSVGACTEAGEMAEFSSYNPERDNPDVAAIGKDVRLARADGTTMGRQLAGPWVKASGTSFSAPAVAGMVARYLSVRGAVAPDRVARDFEANARDIPDQPRDGAGLVDYAATVGRRDGPREPTPEPGPGPGPGRAPATVWETPGRDLVELEADWLPPGRYVASRVDDGGRGTTIRLVAADGGGGADDEAPESPSPSESSTR